MPETRRRNIKYSITSQKSGSRPGSSGPGGNSSGSKRPGGSPSAKGAAPKLGGGIPANIPISRDLPGEASDDSDLAESASSNFADKDITPEFMGGGESDTAEAPPNTKSTDDIANSEANADSLDGNRSAKTDQESKLDDGDDLYNPEGGKNSIAARIIRSKTAQKWVLGGGGVIAVISILANVLFPSFLMTHISDMILDGPASELSSQHMIKYRRTNISRLRDVFSKDGRRGGAIIAKMERKGYIFSFDTVDKNKIVGIRRIGSNVSTPNINGAVDNVIKDFIEKDSPIRSRSAKWKSKNMDAFYSRYKVNRASIVKNTGSSLPDANEEVNKRIKGVIDGNENAVEPQTRTTLSDETPDEERARITAADEVSRGDADLLKSANEKLKAGIKIENLLPEERVILEATQGVSAGLIDAAQRSISLRSGFGSLAGKLGGLFDVTDVPDTLCTINRRLRAVVTIARTAASLQLMRYGYAFVSADDAQRKGEAASKFVGAMMARVTTSDSLGSRFGSSSGYSYATKGTFSKSTNSRYKSSVTVSGTLSGWLAWLQDKSAIPGCSVWTNPVARVGINIGIAVISVFTGGAGGAGAAASATTIRTTAVAAIRQMFTRSGLTAFAAGAIGGLTLEGIALMIQIYAQKKQDIPYTSQEGGGELSMILAASGGVMNKNRGLQAGQVPATVEQYAQARTVFLAEKKKEMSEKPFFARMFDVTDKDSLAYSATASVALNYSGTTTSIENTTSAIAKAPSSVLTSFASLLSPFIPKSGAQEGDQVAFDSYTTAGDNPTTLATGPAGELLPIMREDIAAIDPDENKVALLDPAIGGPYIDATTELPIGKFKEHVENCVENPDTLTVLDENAQPSDPANDCLANIPITKRFKAHLAYLDMLDVLDGALFPNEVGAQTGAATPVVPSQGTPVTSIVAEGLNGFAVPCQGQPRTVVRSGSDAANWSGVPDSGTIGTNSAGRPIKVYIREACPNATDVKTVVLVSSVHGSENGGQLVSHELLFNSTLPPNFRIVAIPEYCSCAGTGIRGNANGVDLNRNNDYEFNSLPQTQTFDSGFTYSKGSAAGSEPETQAVNRFLIALGRANVSLHYHDSLNYAVASSRNALPFYAQYGRAAGIRITDDDNRSFIPQRGSVDSWYNKVTSTPTMLVEMGPERLTDALVLRHVNGVLALINGGSL